MEIKYFSYCFALILVSGINPLFDLNSFPSSLAHPASLCCVNTLTCNTKSLCLCSWECKNLVCMLTGLLLAFPAMMVGCKLLGSNWEILESHIRQTLTKRAINTVFVLHSSGYDMRGEGQTRELYKLLGSNK